MNLTKDNPQMAKRNRNRKRKDKQSTITEEQKKTEETQPIKSVKKKNIEKTETVVKEKVVESTPKESEKKEKKEGNLLKNLLSGSFIVLFALPATYYFTKISPEYISQLDKLGKENQAITKNFDGKLSGVLKTRDEAIEKLSVLKREKEELQKKLTLKIEENKALSSTQLETIDKKEKAFKESSEKETQKSEKLNAELLNTQKTVKELELKLTVETKDKEKLQEKLIFVVTKGKELEDNFKKLKESVQQIQN